MKPYPKILLYCRGDLVSPARTKTENGTMREKSGLQNVGAILFMT